MLMNLNDLSRALPFLVHINDVPSELNTVIFNGLHEDIASLAGGTNVIFLLDLVQISFRLLSIMLVFYAMRNVL